MNDQLQEAQAEISGHFDSPPNSELPLSEYVVAMEKWVCELYRLLNNLYVLEIVSSAQDDGK